jgi:hypothetical protein
LRCTAALLASSKLHKVAKDKAERERLQLKHVMKQSKNIKQKGGGGGAGAWQGGEHDEQFRQALKASQWAQEGGVDEGWGEDDNEDEDEELRRVLEESKREV